MNSTSPGLHMDLLPPHVKEEENGLGVLRNSVSPGRAPGERDRQIMSGILPNLLSYSSRALVAPDKPCCGYGADPSCLNFPGWSAGGRGWHKWAPSTPPTTLSKPLHPTAHTYTMPSFSA